MNYDELMWNFARQEDVLINDMIVAQDRASGKMKVLNEMRVGYQQPPEGDKEDSSATEQGGPGQRHTQQVIVPMLIC